MNAVKELVYAGTGTPTNNFMAPVTWAYIDLPNYEFDPEKAKALFAEAGYPDGFDIEIDTIEGYPDLIAIASIWQDGLKQAGVNATTTIYEINTWLDRWLNSEFQLSTNFDINGPDPQRMFTADYLSPHRAGGVGGPGAGGQSDGAGRRPPSPQSIRRSGRRSTPSCKNCCTTSCP